MKYNKKKILIDLDGVLNEYGKEAYDKIETNKKKYERILLLKYKKLKI